MSTRRTLLPFVLAALSIAGGCLSPNSTTCAGGTVCPPGTVCGPTAEHRCLTLAETTPCKDAPDGTRCAVEKNMGRCSGGICETGPFCGDGVKNGSEQCDGADLAGASCDVLGFYKETPGLGCTQDCTFDTSGCSEICGDGIKNGLEACDGNDVGKATCSAAGYSSEDKPTCKKQICQLDYSNCSGICGDGAVTGSEACDGFPPPTSCVELGFDRGLSGCSASCQVSVDGCGVFDVAWRQLPPSGSPLAIWAAGVDDLFAVGVGGTLSRWNGAAWTASRVTGVDGDLAAVWGRGPSDVFAVGARGTIVHWNGTIWDSMPSETTDDLLSVWTTGQADLFVGGTTSVRRWDGTRWTSNATPDRVNGIWGSGQSDVYAAGDGNTLLHWNGNGWTLLGSPLRAPVPGGSPVGFSSVWGSGPGDVIFVSPRPVGIIMEMTYYGLQPVPGFAPGSSIWAVGGGGAGDEFIGGDKQLLHRLGSISQWEPIALPRPVDVRAIAVADRELFILDRAGEIFLLDRPGIICPGPGHDIGPERNCRDGWDNDCDGLQDALDPDCAGKVEEQCANGADDDGDSLVDCADSDCAWFPRCKGPAGPPGGGQAGTGGAAGTSGAAGTGGKAGAGAPPGTGGTPGTDGTSF